jgi:hypothetical protein
VIYEDPILMEIIEHWMNPFNPEIWGLSGLSRGGMCVGNELSFYDLWEVRSIFQTHMGCGGRIYVARGGGQGDFSPWTFVS